MIWLVDDQHLSNVLRNGHRPEGFGRGDSLYTTGCWYVRLCQAVLSAARRPGVLSGPFEMLPEDQRNRAVVALMELPADIGLVSLRELGPVIGRLRRDHTLNVLGMEALAVSVKLKAHVLLSVASPRLKRWLKAEGRSLTISI